MVARCIRNTNTRQHKHKHKHTSHTHTADGCLRDQVTPCHSTARARANARALARFRSLVRSRSWKTESCHTQKSPEPAVSRSRARAKPSCPKRRAGALRRAAQHRRGLEECTTHARLYYGTAAPQPVHRGARTRADADANRSGRHAARAGHCRQPRARATQGPERTGARHRGGLSR